MKKPLLLVIGGVLFVIGAGVAFLARDEPPKKPLLELSAAPLARLSDGEAHTFATLPSAPRLVNFWATWCAPCIFEMPLLEQASLKYKNVHFSGIAIDHPDLVHPFLDKIGVTYDIWTPKFDIFLLFEGYGNKNGVLPYTLLLDKNGDVIARKIGEFHSVEDIGKFISENLSENIAN